MKKIKLIFSLTLGAYYVVKCVEVWQAMGRDLVAWQKERKALQ